MVLLAMFGCLVIRVRSEMHAFSESLHRTVNRWRSHYHLDDQQVARIVEIEFAFHGNGNFFTKPTHTLEETDQHHREIAAVMKPQDGERFLADQLRRHSDSRY
ncbi:MAG: hypothetical protein RL088_3396 [Verrucomicrobiota bacterium]|jgi:hypothetical protein